MPSNWVSDRFKEIIRVTLGLLTAFMIVAVAGAVVFYVFPTFFGNSGPGWSVEKNDKAAVYYIEEELPELDSKAYLEEATIYREEIVEKLQLTNPPDRVHVYLHRDLSALRSAISRRKSSYRVSTPLATIDLVHGKAIKPLLIRALTALSWDQPSSEFLRLGLQKFLTGQLNRPHIRTAALEEKVFSLEAIQALELAGEIPRTLQEKIYDYFDSPQAPAGMNLSQLGSLIRSRGRERPYQDELEVESVSFVSFLIENYGIAGLRSLWQANSLREGVEEVTNQSLARLGGNWLDFAESRAKGSPYLQYYRAKNLFDQGKLERARQAIDELDGTDFNRADYLGLKGRVAFYRGDWRGAEKAFSRLDEIDPENRYGSQLDSYRKLLDFYGLGETKKGKQITYYGTVELDDIEGKIKRIARSAERAKTFLPRLIDPESRIAVFIYSTEGPAKLWRRLEKPGWVITGSEIEYLRQKVSELIAARVSRTPSYSNLLKQGLVGFLLQESVFRDAQEQLSEGKWTPLNSILLSPDANTEKRTEAGAFVGYLLREYGGEDLSRIWFLTTPLGGDNSLDSALNQVIGLWLDQLEEELKSFLSSRETF